MNDNNATMVGNIMIDTDKYVDALKVAAGDGYDHISAVGEKFPNDK